MWESGRIADALDADLRVAEVTDFEPWRLAAVQQRVLQLQITVANTLPAALARLISRTDHAARPRPLQWSEAIVQTSENVAGECTWRLERFGAHAGGETNTRPRHLGMAMCKAADELLEEEAGLVLGKEAAVSEEVKKLASRRVLHHNCEMARCQKDLHVSSGSPCFSKLRCPPSC